MASFLDYDPLTGVEQWVDGDEANRLQVHYRQDVEPILELTKYERDHAVNDRTVNGKRMALRLYARIPPVIILELKHKYGVDIFKRDHLKRALELINSEYPHIKTTDMVHAVHG